MPGSANVSPDTTLMALRNPYEPPRSEVTEAQARSPAITAAIIVFLLLVFAQLVFDAFYVSFLTTLMKKGTISFVHYLTMIGADALLLVGTLLLIFQGQRATIALLGAALIASASLLLGIWYQVVTCTVLAVVGVLLSHWANRYRQSKQAFPSEA
jgi:hypothetical protein